MKCDIVVVGSGPGGSTAAYWLARFGADVILVDKADFPRNKPCGDALEPGEDELLKVMGMADYVGSVGQSYRGIRIIMPGITDKRIYFDDDSSNKLRQGWVISRLKLDNALCQNAMNAGARFVPGFTARLPYYRQSRLKGVRGTIGGHSLTIQAHLTIVATGANRKFIQSLGICTQERPTALAMRAYTRGIRNQDGCLRFYLNRELIPGYGWVFPTGSDSANIGFVVFLDRGGPGEASRRLKDAFMLMVEHEQSEGAVLMGEPQGYPLRCDYPHIPVYADGLLVVGETAGLVDPITYAGISPAMRSGWLAARIANYALGVGDFSANLLKVYADILSDLNAAYFTQARRFISWLAEPGVIDLLISQAKVDAHITAGLKLTVLGKHPQEGLEMLQERIGKPRVIEG